MATGLLGPTSAHPLPVWGMSRKVKMKNVLDCVQEKEGQEEVAAKKVEENRTHTHDGPPALNNEANMLNAPSTNDTEFILAPIDYATKELQRVTQLAGSAADAAARRSVEASPCRSSSGLTPREAKKEIEKGIARVDVGSSREAVKETKDIAHLRRFDPNPDIHPAIATVDAIPHRASTDDWLATYPPSRPLRARGANGKLEC